MKNAGRKVKSINSCSAVDDVQFPVLHQSVSLPVHEYSPQNMVGPARICIVIKIFVHLINNVSINTFLPNFLFPLTVAVIYLSAVVIQFPNRLYVTHVPGEP